MKLTLTGVDLLCHGKPGYTGNSFTSFHVVFPKKSFRF